MVRQHRLLRRRQSQQQLLEAISYARQIEMKYDRLTPNHSIGSQFLELVVQLLPQSFNILLLAFVRMLEPFSIGRRYVMEVIMVQDSLVRCAPTHVGGE